MGPGNPRDEAWARYYRAHPEVVASWGEQNGRQPNCGCPACVAEGLPAYVPRED